MTVVGDMPVEAAEAPKPKSRKKLIIAAVVAVAVVGGGVAALTGMTQGPGPEVVAKSYLQALSDGKGDVALKALTPQVAAAFTDDSSKALEAASARVQDVKVGEEAGAKPVVQDKTATVKYGYVLDGGAHSGELGLQKGDDGAWKIVRGADGIVPNVHWPELYFTGYGVKLGDGPVLKSDSKTVLFPAVYSVAVTGSEYLKIASIPKAAMTADKKPDPIEVAMDINKTMAGLQVKFAKFVQDCLATGQFAPKYKGENCGVTPEQQDVFLNTVDTTKPNLLNVKITKAPSVSEGTGNGLQVVASFSAAGTHTFTERGDSKQRTDPFEKTVLYKGNYGLNEKGEPMFKGMATVKAGVFDDAFPVNVMAQL